MSERTLDDAREQLLRDVTAEANAILRRLGLGPLPARIVAALGAVSRADFVASGDKHRAFENRPLPIEWGQTISQPLIVAVMTALLDPEPEDRMLELGTGSGYQAAVLSTLVGELHSIEARGPLLRAAASRLAALGYANVHCHHGDGTTGWPAAAPFDGILVTAAVRQVPEALLAQLKPSAHLVVPVDLAVETPGGTDAGQTLERWTRQDDGRLTRDRLFGVRFVPAMSGTLT